MIFFYFLISLYFLLFLFLTLKNIKLAILILIFALPSYLIRFKIFFLPTNILELMILTIFFVYFFKNFKKLFAIIKNKFQKNENYQKYPFDIEIALIMISSFVGLAIANFSWSALGIWRAYFLEPLLLYIVIINIFKEKKDLIKIIWAAGISSFFVSALAIYQKISGDLIFNPFWAQEANRRVVSFFGYPNAVGLYLETIIFIMLGLLFYYLKNQKNYLKIISLILLITISLISIFFAKSEGALIACLISFIIFLLFSQNKKISSYALVIIIISFSLFIKTDFIRNKVEDKIFLNNLSGEIRKAQWRETLKMLKDGRIFFGAGLNNYQKTIKPYHSEGIFYNKENDPDFRRKIVIFDEKYKKDHWQPTEIYLYPHNIFLNFWTEIGLLGSLTFLFLIFRALYIAFKNNVDDKENKYLHLGLATALLTVLIHGLVDVPYFKNDLAVFFWIIMAMIGLLNIFKKNNKKI